MRGCQTFNIHSNSVQDDRSRPQTNVEHQQHGRGLTAQGLASSRRVEIWAAAPPESCDLAGGVLASSATPERQQATQLQGQAEIRPLCVDVRVHMYSPAYRSKPVIRLFFSAVLGVSIESG